MSLKDDTDSALAGFRMSFESGRFAHAYLLEGDGTGRLAEGILCVLCCGSSGARPCGECSACRKVARRMHPDMLWVEPQKKSRTIQREQFDLIQEHVNHTAYEGGWKAVVLVSAECMNATVSNAILKMLEEPPDATLFLLLSDAPESLPATVRSRCQRVAVAAPDAMVDPAVIVEIVTDKSLAGEGVIPGIARARFLMDKLNMIKKELESDEKGDRAEEKDVSAARVESRYVAARDALLRSLLCWSRDLLLARTGADSDLFCFKEQSDLIIKAGGELTWRMAMANIRLVEIMKSQLDRHVPESMVFERAMTGLRLGW